MRLRKREVTDLQDVYGILARCNTVRIGMHGDKYPYIVPVSFGMEVIDGKGAIYFHCGKKGMKVELLKQNPFVCIEADIHYAYELLVKGVDTRYESVIGYGTCVEVFDEEKAHGLELLCEHCGYAGHPIDVCLGLPITSVYKVSIEEITGKRTLPEFWKQDGSGVPDYQ